MRIGYVTQWFPPEPGALVPSTITDTLAERVSTFVGAQRATA